MSVSLGLIALHLLEFVRLVQHNARNNGSQHARQHNAQSDATGVDLVTWIIPEHHLKRDRDFKLVACSTVERGSSYRIEQRGDGIEDAHVDAIGEQQKDEIAIGHQIL